MILITLGTQDKDFSRLLKAVDKEIEKGNIKEEVIVQAGYTKYESKNMKIFDLIETKEFEKLIKKCDILITHGGVGSILTGIKNNKKVIAAARLKKYKEHTNDHQKQIIKEFVKRGYILELDNFNNLDNLLKEVKKFKPVKYKSNNKEFIKLIDNYINEDDHESWFNKYRYLTSYGYRGGILSLINILIFCLLYSKYNLYLNIVLSFVLTLLVGIIHNKMLDIKNNKKGFITTCLSLILDLDLMYIFTSILNFNIIESKFITDLIIMIINIIIIKLCFRKEV